MGESSGEGNLFVASDHAMVRYRSLEGGTQQNERLFSYERDNIETFRNN